MIRLFLLLSLTVIPFHTAHSASLQFSVGKRVVTVHWVKEQSAFLSENCLPTALPRCQAWMSLKPSHPGALPRPLHDPSLPGANPGALACQSRGGSVLLGIAGGTPARELAFCHFQDDSWVDAASVSP